MNDFCIKCEEGVKQQEIKPIIIDEHDLNIAKEKGTRDFPCEHMGCGGKVV